MPNATDQPTDRSRRVTLLIVLLAAAIGVGLWYALERPRTAESVTESQTGDAGTAAPTDITRSTDTAPATDTARTTGTAPTADTARTTGTAQTTGTAELSISGPDDPVAQG